MTRIVFKISAEDQKDQYVEIDRKKSKDAGYYHIYKILVFDEGWTKKQSNWPKNSESYKFKLNSVKTFPMWLKIYLEKTDSEIKGYSKNRCYYLHLYEHNKDIFIDTYAKPRINSGYVKTKEKQSAWCDSIWKENDSNLLDKYNDILRFYLLNCPSKAKRAPSKQFTDIYSLWGRNCFKNKDQLKARLSVYEVMGINDKTGGIASTAKDMKHRIEAFDLLRLRENELASMSKENRVVIVDTEDNQYLSLFRHLRNAIAHGSFLIYKHNSNHSLIFQDSDTKNNVTARGIIDMSTLEKWRKILLINILV